MYYCLSSDGFDELFEATLKLDYYMPTKSIIRTYATKGYDEPNFKEINKLREFLSEFINDERIMEDLPYDLFRSCERLKSPDRVIEALKNAGAPLKDQVFCVRFERLYSNLRSNVHVWELRGFWFGREIIHASHSRKNSRKTSDFTLNSHASSCNVSNRVFANDENKQRSQRKIGLYFECPPES